MVLAIGENFIGMGLGFTCVFYIMKVLLILDKLVVVYASICYPMIFICYLVFFPICSVSVLIL